MIDSACHWVLSPDRKTCPIVNGETWELVDLVAGCEGAKLCRDGSESSLPPVSLD